MEIINKIKPTRERLKQWENDGFTIGFVPTMGALHEGHLSLIQRSLKDNDKTVVSIFINPSQFAPGEDFKSYPRTLKADILLCEKAGVSLVFNPSADEIYPADFSTFVDVNSMTELLCAKSRPSHFRGVCTIVNKLFNIITPDRAYFGQKDAQQLAVIKRMAKDLNLNLEIVGMSIVREPDGLAKSSRNVNLNPHERAAATVISKAVFEGERLVKSGERNPENVIAAMRQIIEQEPLAKIDYIEIVDGNSIKRLKELKSGSVLAAVAVYVGTTRLIDNFVIEL
ncbi:MAG: pantoate--beta-alanine ligase [Oscillospiraceae bacterium]|nr:pantoate--beta-alanine ligase [Oscillospiraceae bacterium]